MGPKYILPTGTAVKLQESANPPPVPGGDRPT